MKSRGWRDFTISAVSLYLFFCHEYTDLLLVSILLTFLGMCFIYLGLESFLAIRAIKLTECQKGKKAKTNEQT